MKRWFGIFVLIAAVSCSHRDGKHFDVIVAGGGASGVCAGIQAARSGAETLILEEGPWLGGMLTSAGVSAIDGNYRLRAGLFGEFCDSLAARYGGYEALKTGWVSDILFQPHVGAEVLDNIAAAETRLTVRKGTAVKAVEKQERGWRIITDAGCYSCKVLIDCTELGDVARMCGVNYNIGNAEGIIQDLTYVVTIRDYGPDADRTIAEPEGYDEALYVNCCLNPRNVLPFEKGQALWSPEMMLSYGRLPGGDIMLNWPIDGNDFYANIIDATPEERSEAIRQAKNKALGYLYFIQTALGFKNYGIAEGEYPTEDGLPLIPYYRESRRIEGEARFTFEAASAPYDGGNTLYRTGVAVGDYPVDHHHYAHPDWRNLHKSYSPIPSFTVPAGTMIPIGVEDLIVAEKSICTDCVVNGTTRLQPVVMELGQAAGLMAAMAAGNGCRVRELKVREIQSELLDAGARIQPYLDLMPEDPDFKALQRAGSSGAFRAEGRFENWRGESWLLSGHPERLDSVRTADNPAAFSAPSVSWPGH
ncbi:MAG: FAD-dependent oxidoreductase [Bacteroidales bacterium]|nr:FAD-dependent oxidoreductase [Bacteroidales bacterium]